MNRKTLFLLALGGFALAQLHDLVLTSGKEITSFEIESCDGTGRWPSCMVVVNGYRTKVLYEVVRDYKRGDPKVAFVDGYWLSRPSVVKHR